MSKTTMQSWADHCSSSEDEAEEYPNNNDNSKDIAEEEDATKLQGIAEDTNNTQNDFFDSYNNNNTNEQTLPTSPPFRAFIRNLIPGLVDKDIAQELEELTNYAIKCSNLKIMRPKAQQQQYSNQPPPYCNGYVDVETVEQVTTFERPFFTCMTFYLISSKFLFSFKLFSPSLINFLPYSHYFCSLRFF